jgi:hypothetical protein
LELSSKGGEERIFSPSLEAPERGGAKAGSSVPHELSEKLELKNKLARAGGATNDTVGGSSGSSKAGKKKVRVRLTGGRADADFKRQDDPPPE